MISYHDISGFAFENESLSYEANVVALWSNKHRIPRGAFKKASDVPANWIPVGSVNWVQSILGKIIKPDYYPEFCQSYIYRKIWFKDVWDKSTWPVFVKPADQYKRFDGRIYGEIEPNLIGPFVFSELVNFHAEWRYYIVNGKVIYSAWYKGFPYENEPIPELNINIPADYCGSIDMGLNNRGKLELVEAHHPFACGWYGKYTEAEIYIDWLVHGYNYIKKL